MRVLTFVAALAVCGVVGASEYVDGWGLPVGEAAPVISAQDQTGAVRNLASLYGDNGLLLFFNRSVDW